MGLDMYLSVRKYVSAIDWRGVDKLGPEESISDYPNLDYAEVTERLGLKPFIANAAHSGMNVTATAVYWRKANAIHKWFVDNLADGVDDCRPLRVSTDHLKELFFKVCEVLASNKDPQVAEEVLPSEDGLFFGDTSYREAYWDDLEYTQKALEKILTLAESDEGKAVDFEYQASW
jgi:hypothetical protein